MPRRPAAHHFTSSPDEVEAEFYEALNHADLERMMSCWADEDDMVCVHPGGQRLVGEASIRAAFEALFSNGAVTVQASEMRRVESLTSAVHSVVELIQVQTPDGPRQATVLATNVYQKTPQGWRMVAHHASPGAVLESAPTPSSISKTLH